MKSSVITVIGITSCLGVAVICTLCGKQVVKHMNETADYSIIKDQLYYTQTSSPGDVMVTNASEDTEDGTETNASSIPFSITVGDKVYYLITTNGTDAVPTSTELSVSSTDADYADADITQYNGYWYGNDSYFASIPDSEFVPPVDTGGSGSENDRYSNNEYIVTDIDGNFVYLVKKGDTLTDVSSRISYSVDEIAEYNHIRDVNLIYAGETLRVPE